MGENNLGQERPRARTIGLTSTKLMLLAAQAGGTLETEQGKNPPLSA
jgi:hypothetical protein